MYIAKDGAKIAVSYEKHPINLIQIVSISQYGYIIEM